ncbi:hypothetical protein [Armatimonas sp.]|uniref:hypothetical protein n=1 Tax=Armatimonas sp. TaxID=1872638 RepID=UPI00286C15CA|nr:hypothetical protein [Armatimonas sp.]
MPPIVPRRLKAAFESLVPRLRSRSATDPIGVSVVAERLFGGTPSDADFNRRHYG